MVRPGRKPTKKVVQEPEEYEVESIVSHRLSNDDKGKPKLLYLIKWKDFPVSANTWEPSNAVSAEELVNQYWNLNGGQQKREEINAKLAGQPAKRKASPKEITKATASKKSKKINSDFYESESDMDFSESEIENDTFRKNGIWKDVYKVKTVRPGDGENSKKLYAIVRWSDGKLAKYPTSFVASKIPLKLIHYYEKRLLFEKAKDV